VLGRLLWKPRPRGGPLHRVAPEENGGVNYEHGTGQSSNNDDDKKTTEKGGGGRGENTLEQPGETTVTRRKRARRRVYQATRPPDGIKTYRGVCGVGWIDWLVCKRTSTEMSISHVRNTMGIIDISPAVSKNAYISL